VVCYNKATKNRDSKEIITMHAYTALLVFGVVAPIVFIIIPMVVESILLNKELKKKED